MFSLTELHDLRCAVHAECAEIERLARLSAGSYRYLCSLDGNAIYTHHPVGKILREFPRK